MTAIPFNLEGMLYGVHLDGLEKLNFGSSALREERAAEMTNLVMEALKSVAGRYVMVGFETTELALKFLDHLATLDEMDRKLLVAKRTEDGKVSLTKYGIRTAYLRDI